MRRVVVSYVDDQGVPRVWWYRPDPELAQPDIVRIYANGVLLQSHRLGEDQRIGPENIDMLLADPPQEIVALGPKWRPDPTPRGSLVKFPRRIRSTP